MADKLLWRVLVLTLLVALFLTQGRRTKVKVPSPPKGISHASWQHDAYDTPEASRSISLLKETNVEWVSPVVTWYQGTVDSPMIYRDPRLTPDAERSDPDNRAAPSVGALG
jgi:hypothetical protein